MTAVLSPRNIADRLEKEFPGSIVSSDDNSFEMNSTFLVPAARFLKDTPGLDFDFLSYITGIDRYDHFELVYHLVSLKHNHSLTFKVRCYGRDNPSAPSLTPVWRGADFQEREIFDLLGVRFEGHPNLKRIVLWEGFDGHPLRKDFLG
ncbi:MAG: NADH-quinone oxidoreductase subunit C [Chloroflexi bacterium]|nr:NADH-quinone oxidoreductase subunit C [Chloroflexota bacterium]